MAPNGGREGGWAKQNRYCNCTWVHLLVVRTRSGSPHCRPQLLLWKKRGRLEEGCLEEDNLLSLILSLFGERVFFFGFISEGTVVCVEFRVGRNGVEGGGSMWEDPEWSHVV